MDDDSTALAIGAMVTQLRVAARMLMGLADICDQRADALTNGERAELADAIRLLEEAVDRASDAV
ncbi:MAG: hypothetical protein JWR83_1765 [Aeromicrobium sp.]|nr:hypothetical protein [Aeromicrobium sp.]